MTSGSTRTVPRAPRYLTAHPTRLRSIRRQCNVDVRAVELTVIAPCLNEEGNIPELVSRIATVFGDRRFRERGGAELVLVDDGSTDATWSAITSERAKYDFVVPLRHERNAGLAEAWRTAAARARGRLVCVLDADLQYRPEDILTLYDALERSQVDIAQGWRSRQGRERDTRYLVSRGLHHLLDRLFDMQTEDNKSGFFLCSREVLATLLDYRGRYAYWQIFVGVAARANGFTFCHVEIPFEPRRRGQSFLSNLPVRVILRASIDIVRALREYRGRIVRPL